MYTKRKESLPPTIRERIVTRFGRSPLNESKEKDSDSFEKFKEKYHARRFKEAWLKRAREAWDDGIEDVIASERRRHIYYGMSPEDRYFSGWDPVEEGWEEEEKDKYFIPSEEDFAQLLHGGDPKAVSEAAKIIHDWYIKQDYQDDFYDIDDFYENGLDGIRDWVEEGDFTAEHTPIIKKALRITKKEESKKIKRNVKLSEIKTRRFSRY